MVQILCGQGHTEHDSSFEYCLDSTQDWWLLIQTRTTAYFIINGKRVTMPPHTAILYPPYSEVHYGAANGEDYSDDWLRFYTDEQYVTHGDIPFSKPFATTEYIYITNLFDLLASENFFENRYKTSSIQALFQVLFSKLSESIANNTDDFKEQALQQLHLNIRNNPAFPWTVPEMAKQLYICPRHLQSLYQKRYGISCMDDVIKSRISLAKDKLVHTDMPIYKVAETCGYSNTEHFSRQFKKNVGMSPQKYRKQGSV